MEEKGASSTVHPYPTVVNNKLSTGNPSDDEDSDGSDTLPSKSLHTEEENQQNDDAGENATTMDPDEGDNPAFKASFVAFGASIRSKMESADNNSFKANDKPMRLIDVLDTISSEVAEIRLLKIRILESTRYQGKMSPRGGRRIAANDPWARTMRRKELQQRTPVGATSPTSPATESFHASEGGQQLLTLPTATEIFDLEQKILRAKSDHNTYITNLFVTNDLTPYPEELFDLRRGFIGRIGASTNQSTTHHHSINHFSSIYGRSVHDTTMSSLDLTTARGAAISPKAEPTSARTIPKEQDDMLVTEPTKPLIPSAEPPLVNTTVAAFPPTPGSIGAFLQGIAAIDAADESGEVDAKMMKTSEGQPSQEGDADANHRAIHLGDLMPISPPQSLLSASVNLGNTVQTVMETSFSPPLSPTTTYGRSMAERHRVAQLDAGDLAIPAPRRFGGVAVDDEGIPIALQATRRPMKDSNAKGSRGSPQKSSKTNPVDNKASYRSVPSPILTKVLNDPKLQFNSNNQPGISRGNTSKSSKPNNNVASTDTSANPTKKNVVGLSDAQLRELQKSTYPPMGTHQQVHAGVSNTSLGHVLTGHNSSLMFKSVNEDSEGLKPISLEDGQSLRESQKELFNKIGNVVDTVRAAVAPTRNSTALRKGLFGDSVPAFAVFRRKEDEHVAESQEGNSSVKKCNEIEAFEGGHEELPIITRKDIMDQHRRTRRSTFSATTKDKTSRYQAEFEVTEDNSVLPITPLPTDMSVLKHIEAPSLSSVIKDRILQRLRPQTAAALQNTDAPLSSLNAPSKSGEISPSLVLCPTATLQKVQTGHDTSFVSHPITGTEFRRPARDLDFISADDPIDVDGNVSRPATALLNAFDTNFGERPSTSFSLSRGRSVSAGTKSNAANKKLPGSSEGPRPTSEAPTHRLDFSGNLSGVVTTTHQKFDLQMASKEKTKSKGATQFDVANHSLAKQTTPHDAQSTKTQVLSRPNTSNSRHKQAIRDASAAGKAVLLLNDTNGPQLAPFPIRQKGHSGPLFL